MCQLKYFIVFLHQISTFMFYVRPSTLKEIFSCGVLTDGIEHKAKCEEMKQSEKRRQNENFTGEKAVGLKGMSFCTLLGLSCRQAAIWEGKVCDCVSSHLSFTLAPAAGPFSMARVKYQRVCIKSCRWAFPYWEVSVKLCETQLIPLSPRMAWRAHAPLCRTQELYRVQHLPLLRGSKRTEK